VVYAPRRIWKATFKVPERMFHRQALLIFTHKIGPREICFLIDANMDFLSLFSYGDLPSKATISTRVPETEEPSHSNIIRVLSIATALDVNIFPLTWRPALEGLGEGATGRISQSPMNARISLAFKRLSRWSRCQGLSEAQFRALQHKALVSEMVALSCPELYGHPNIANLEGLCWELSNEGHSPEALPVLVFRKAEFGDLRRFLSLPEAENLEIGNRLDICGEIAKALEIMHLCGNNPAHK
jgi:hypothetical protein